jgi:hypothetical protein
MILHDQVDQLVSAFCISKQKLIALSKFFFWSKHLNHQEEHVVYFYKLAYQLSKYGNHDMLSEKNSE